MRSIEGSFLPPYASKSLRAIPMTAAIAVLLALLGCESESMDPVVDGVTDESVEATESGQPTGSQRSSKRRSSSKPQRGIRVAQVIDGDTVDLGNGRTVRLVQIDAPESSGECYGAQAGAVLSRILPSGSRVILERDPALDDVDAYGRLLRYVRKGGTNVNLELVRRGAASVWFYDGDRGRHADQLLATARNARGAERGVWGACRARLDPYAAFDTERQGFAPLAGGAGGGSCAAGYSPCLPIRSDLSCDQIEQMGKTPVRVRGSDPYEIRGDGDGIGCEA
jgi:endonuclease YncB( thermonuclease family)